MTERPPERIWAFYAPEVGEDNPLCSIVAGEHVMHGAAPYIRADLFTSIEAERDALAARVAELEGALKEIANYSTDCHAYDHDMDHEFRDFDEGDLAHIESIARTALHREGE